MVKYLNRAALGSMFSSQIFGILFGRELELFSLEKRLRGYLTVASEHLTGICRMEEDYLQGPGVTG